MHCSKNYFSGRYVNAKGHFGKAKHPEIFKKDGAKAFDPLGLGRLPNFKRKSYFFAGAGAAGVSAAGGAALMASRCALNCLAFSMN